MNGYLVVFSGVMDDLPIGLVADEAAADRLALELREEFKKDEFKSPILSGVLKTLGLDTSTFINIAVAKFVNGKLHDKNVLYDESDLDV